MGFLNLFLTSVSAAVVCLGFSFFNLSVAAVQKNEAPLRDLTEYSAAQIEKLQKGWGEDGTHKLHCRATEEYIKTLEFLRKDQTIPEKEIRKISEKVSAGCNGASSRFSRAYLLMKKSGLSFQKSVDVGLAMVKEDSITSQNFYDIFEKMYLGEYFNVNFQTSFEIAYQLSKEFKGDLNFARDDFNQFSKFCLDQKKVGLPVSACAKLAVRFARLSQFYPRPLFQDFKGLYDMLRDDKRFGLSMQEALNLSEKVLKNGPLAKTNFLQAYNYSISKDGLQMTGREALNFALRLADQSFTGTEPPLYPGEQLTKILSQDETPATAGDSE